MSETVHLPSSAPPTTAEGLHQAQTLARQLAQRWRGRRAFTVLSLDWRQGLDWLATWAAWRADPQRCETLVWVVVSPEIFEGPQPPQPPAWPPEHAADAGAGADNDLAAWPALWAHLQGLWPPATPDLHSLLLEDGRLQLQLAPGLAQDWWAQLRLQADAVVLPNTPPAAWGGLPAAKALARQATPGAALFNGGGWPAEQAQQLQAVGWAPLVVDGRAAAGSAATTAPQEWPAPAVARPDAPEALETPSGQGGPSAALRVRAQARRHSPTAPAGVQRKALVLGAGLAGAATAMALARLGWQVQVLDQNPGPAQATSGNPGGLFHGTAHGDDGLHARLLRAAALFAARDIAPRVAAGLPGQADGLLRLQTLSADLAGEEAENVALAAAASQPDWPATWLQRLDRQQASAWAGLALPAGGTWFPGGGWASPAHLVRAWLQHPAISFLGNCAVQRLAFRPWAAPALESAIPTGPAAPQQQGDWQLLNAGGEVLAQAPVLVLAAAAGQMPLLAAPDAPGTGLQAHAGLPWPLGLQRGQVSWWQGGQHHQGGEHSQNSGLRHPVAGGGGGYALPLPGGLLFGATTQRGDADPAVRASDHAHNLLRLKQLTGLDAPQIEALQGRVGWRLVSEDRLPVAGPVPTGVAPRFATQADAWARAPGLFVCTALGGRGLTLAPLLGQLVAAQVAGLPAPLPQRLVEAVDPARWLIKRARRAG